MQNNIDIEQALLQKPPMRLIDKVIEVTDAYAICQKTITDDDSLFYCEDIKGFYAWTGIEMMAQTAAVYVYYKSAQNQHKLAEPKLAFLTSVRQFNMAVPFFKEGSTLTIISNNSLLDDNVAAFECEIHLDNEVIAQGRLTAYQPADNELNTILAG